ncbi:helix-turn-helix domain-containing protein [Shewanella surugensis]|uniref:Helix-turn-helix domain-containing protein n=1 Tax=Shewanella surugensis TaxID=212020 RepID=A0ABT0L944_9GAMM|nr:helix-turn-helix domain-containing protein [Shewanella surugensis]MCL1124211.1 helix-turn-helix domain-containing protein [Shewanella surugensis]
MTLKDYFNSLPLNDKKILLSKLALSLSKAEISIRSYINGSRKIQSVDVAAIIECCDGFVTKHDLRPDVFPEILETDKESSA